MFVPSDYNKTNGEVKYKKIMVAHGMREVKTGNDFFAQQGCPVSTCSIIRDNLNEADLVLFKDYITSVGRRPPNQVYEKLNN